MLPTPVYGIFDIFGFLSDMHFVLQILVLAYLLSVLYRTFYENQLLFGVSGIAAAYFVLFQSLLTAVIVVFFVAFIQMGFNLQMLIQVGVYPLLRIFGIEPEHPEMAEQQKMQAIERKLQEGHELNAKEVEFLEQSQRKQSEYQKHVQQYMRPMQ